METILLVYMLNSQPKEICRFTHSPKDENLTVLVQDVAKSLDIKTEFQITRICK